MQQKMRPDVAKDTSGRNFRSVLAPIKRATKRVMVVQLKGVWLYDYRVYGCTTIRVVVVRLKGVVTRLGRAADCSRQSC